MKKQYQILLIISFLLLLTACNYEKDTIEKEEGVNGNNEKFNPVGTISAEIQTYAFEEAIKESELIAELEITEKVRELNEPSAKTIYKAKIIEGIKKDSKLTTDNLHIMQQGNSEWIFNGNEMFQPGEKYILFLKNAINIQEEDTYWILGEETGMYKKIDDKYIAKLSQKDEALADIEEKKLSDELTKTEKSSKEIQVILKEEFKEKVKKSLKRN
ncbi:hypothetical protein ACLM5H_26240 [Fredinandcohnia humi]